MFAPTGRRFQVPEVIGLRQAATPRQTSAGRPESAVWGNAGMESRPAPIRQNVLVLVPHSSAVWGTAAPPTTISA